MNWHCKGSIRYYRYLDSQKKYLYMPLQLGCFLFFRRLTIYISPANAVLPFFITWLLLTPFVYQAGRGKQKKEALQKKEGFQRSSITHLSLYFTAPSYSSSQRSVSSWRKWKMTPRDFMSTTRRLEQSFFLLTLSKHLTFETKSTLLTELEQVAGGAGFFATFSCPLLRRVYTFAAKPGTVYCSLDVRRNRKAQLNTRTARPCNPHWTGIVKPISQNRPSEVHFQ